MSIDTIISFTKKYYVTILFAAIFLIGLYFRFQNVPLKYAFDFDPGRDGLIAYYGSRNFEFPLVGASSGIGSFSFGPWYYWQLIIFSLLIPTIWAPWIYIGLFSVGFMLVMYQIGKELEGKIFGLILLTLAAFSPAQVGPTAGLSNPNLVPLHAALTVYLGIIFFKRTPQAFLAVLWGLCVGIGINNHFQMLLLLIVPAAVLLCREKKSIKDAGLFLLGLSISFLPLLMFNIYTNWHTITGFGSFLANTGGATYVPNSWTIYLTEFWPTFFAYVLGVPIAIAGLFFILLAIIYGYLIFKRKLPILYWLLGICFFIIFVVLRYYSGERQYYYLLFLHPLLFLFVGYALLQLTKYKKTAVVCLLLLLLCIGFATPLSLQRGNSREENIRFEKIAQEIVTMTNGKPVDLYNCEEYDLNRPQGVLFFLLAKGTTVDSTGEKIGIAHSSCIDTNQLPPDQSAVRLTKNGSDEFHGHGWKQVTLEGVYNKTVTWWKQ